MNQVWIVKAVEEKGDHERVRFEWAFPDRETARKVYLEGERTVRDLCLYWSLSMAPYNNVDHALHYVRLLADGERPEIKPITP